MSPETSGDWQRARRVLCVRLDQLGDVLMTTPAIRALKESGSGRRITLLTSSAGAAVA
jgi:ADP-heptose:LPS heptosyltransferase